MLRHLATVRKLLLAAPASCAGGAVSEAAALVAHAEDATRAFYGRLTMGQLHLLRQTLARFFQDKRVKVSLFLAEGIQGASSGRLILPGPGGSSGSSGSSDGGSGASSGGSKGSEVSGTEDVGMVRSFDSAGRVEQEERLPLACLQVRVWRSRAGEV